jgi:hypothetical protein
MIHGRMQSKAQILDVELTSPYMHDGSVKTLIDVVHFYNRGGNANSHLDERMHPLQLVLTSRVYDYTRGFGRLPMCRLRLFIRFDGLLIKPFLLIRLASQPYAVNISDPIRASSDIAQSPHRTGPRSRGSELHFCCRGLRLKFDGSFALGDGLVKTPHEYEINY